MLNAYSLDNVWVDKKLLALNEILLKINKEECLQNIRYHKKEFFFTCTKE